MTSFFQKHRLALVAGSIVTLSLIAGGYFLNKKLMAYHPEYATNVVPAGKALRTPLTSPLYPSSDKIQTYAERGTKIAVTLSASVDYQQGPFVDVFMYESKNCQSAGAEPLTFTAKSNMEYHKNPLHSQQTWCLDPTKLDQLEIVHHSGKWTDGKDKYDMASTAKYIVVKGKTQTVPVYLTGLAVEPCASQSECSATVKVGYQTTTDMIAPIYIEDTLLDLQFRTNVSSKPLSSLIQTNRPPSGV